MSLSLVTKKTRLQPSCWHMNFKKTSEILSKESINYLGFYFQGFPPSKPTNMTVMISNKIVHTYSRIYCGPTTEDHPYLFFLRGINNCISGFLLWEANLSFYCDTIPTLKCRVFWQIVFNISGSPVQCFSHSLLAIKPFERKWEMKS